MTDGATHVRTNRARWNEISDDYQRLNGPQIRQQAFTGDISWGLWEIPESRLGVLGEVAGRDVLEMGCGGGQWSTALVRRGARAVGLDLSERQLLHSRRLAADTGLTFPLVQASAEAVPFADASFDIVFADHGAFSFADPLRAVPEAARVLRPGGLLAFSHVSPIYEITVRPGRNAPGTRLTRDYFGLRLVAEADGLVSMNLPYGSWIRLFRDSGLIVEDLLEPRPPASTGDMPAAEVSDAGGSTRERAEASAPERGDEAWAHRWPSECIWRLRKPTR
ncbi:putative SAM-dependent methyltransferase [Frankia canadensis]|uniref:Putative SAM-dependent methyltransferase n=1 Tax=Frankia canadensis TaxID=1836972 RepID=A0A2I2KT07_9ACTN|nr:class I SAM-dependent methyltransferase [Frankia canadensis]SNQ48790.1 putative SAM-dependent methyltransferase [Frankia canadensis]SOU56080.1 putative SAM-dependent methyltransferase [Frankia canadensis]